VIDPDTSSKLIVTTRIRGLIKGGSEVAIGTLSQQDALQLLAATAGVDNYAPQQEGGAEDGDQCSLACEVVDLCGYLALTLTIAGGMISEANGIDSDLVAVLRSEGFHDADEEGQESVEDRVITASLKMIRKSKKKSAGLAEQLMLFYAVFAEDVPIPIAVLKTCVPSVVMNTSQSEKTGHATRIALSTLLNYSLIKGGFEEGSGTWMHDIIRGTQAHAPTCMHTRTHKQTHARAQTTSSQNTRAMSLKYCSIAW